MHMTSQKIARASFAILFLFVVTAQAQTHTNALSLGQLSDSLQDLSAHISPSVVQIVGTGFGFHDDSGHSDVNVLSKQRSTGSGVIVSTDGYIMTNAHVVEGATTIRVKANSHDGRSSMFDGKLVGVDRLIDL